MSKAKPTDAELSKSPDFRGDGRRRRRPLEGAWNQSEPYVLPKALREAVHLAMFLRRPLLLEGEPGTGKTRLAHAVAYELGWPLLEIYVRSTSRAQDLLWTFDYVQRLYDIQSEALARYGRPSMPAADGLSKEKDGSNNTDRKYVKIGKLGQAIELSMRGIPSVVLIDEVDKADLDFPNDLLQVLDRLQFEVAEVPSFKFDAFGGLTREQCRDRLPLFLITSNHEKELPGPFLRRCLYYYISFPHENELKRILQRHFGRRLTALDRAAVRRFSELRDSKRFDLRKPPSTSELIDWVLALEREQSTGALTGEALENEPLDQIPGQGVLLKTQVDREHVTATVRREKKTHASSTPRNAPRAKQ